MYSNQTQSHPQDLNFSNRSDPFNYSLSLNSSSFIRRLPGPKTINLGRNIEVAVLFQAAEIERLNSVIESMRGSTKGVNRDHLDRHSYEIQIKEMSIIIDQLRQEKSGLEKYIKEMKIAMEEKSTLVSDDSRAPDQSNELSKLKNKYERALLEIEKMFNDNSNLQQEINQLSLSKADLQEKLRQGQQNTEKINNINSNNLEEKIKQRERNLESKYKSHLSELQSAHGKTIADLHSNFTMEFNKYRIKMEEEMKLRLEQEKHEEVMRVRQDFQRNYAQQEQENSRAIFEQNLKMNEQSEEINRQNAQIRQLEANISEILHKRRQEEQAHIESRHREHQKTMNARQKQLENTIAMLSQEIQRLTRIVGEKNADIDLLNQKLKANYEELVGNKRQFQEELEREKGIFRQMELSTKSSIDRYRRQIDDLSVNFEKKVNIEKIKLQSHIQKVEFEKNRMRRELEDAEIHQKQLRLEIEKQAERVKKLTIEIEESEKEGKVKSQKIMHLKTQIENDRQQFQRQNRIASQKIQRLESMKGALQQQLHHKNSEINELIYVRKGKSESYQQEVGREEVLLMKEAVEKERKRNREERQSMRKQFEREMKEMREMYETQRKEGQDQKESNLIFEYLQKINEGLHRFRTQIMLQNDRQDESAKIQFTLDYISKQMGSLLQEVFEIKQMNSLQNKSSAPLYSQDYVNQLKEQVDFYREEATKKSQNQRNDKSSKQILEELEHQRWAQSEESEKWRVTISKQNTEIEDLRSEIKKMEQTSGQMNSHKEEYKKILDENRSREIQILRASHQAEMFHLENQYESLSQKVLQKNKAIEKLEQLSESQSMKIHQMQTLAEMKGDEVEGIKRDMLMYERQFREDKEKIKEVQSKIGDIIAGFQNDVHYIDQLEKANKGLEREVYALKCEKLQIIQGCRNQLEEVIGNIGKDQNEKGEFQIDLHRNGYEYNENEQQSHRMFMNLQKEFGRLERMVMQLKKDNYNLVRKTYQESSTSHIYRQFTQNKLTELNKEIDRLAGENLDLKDELCRCRMQLTCELGDERRGEENLSTMVLLFAEIESLRQRM